MLILIPDKFFIPVKYVDKNLLNLYGLHDKKVYPYKKSKKYKNRDSIIDYFRDMEEYYNDEDNNDLNYDLKIYAEIDNEYADEYSVEDNLNNNEYDDLFLELDNENVEEV